MSDENREQGVELGELGTKLEEHDYPASQDELLEAYGEEEVKMDEETTTFQELLEPFNEDGYESAAEVEQAIVTMVGDEAIGRKNYSDRTPPAPGEDRQDEGAPGQDGQREQESF
ncbi:hypothetical protein Halru_2604 [Halovivax ruber XH-70]|uniref:DUF2795 domain-containing protein n=1 Tax=Halovivax ruber (strain DSM 18193 / JCM 13892 / XH-70) TaxID=797302 RepID=L0IC84_HALRX|nr:hypothetical protein [Halovivax ruber]AGB17185.1 hypothetical protein Halru_2604 [Halovivax ruber XH-70]